MSGLKAIKRRIRSVQSTQQITRVMKMVAAAKLRRAQENIVAARPYALRLRQVIRELAAQVDRDHHPLLKVNPLHEVGLVVVTGDRGLCGSFNTSIVRRAQRLMEENEVYTLRLITVGRRGSEFFTRRGADPVHKMAGFFNTLDFAHAVALGNQIIDHYSAGTMDRILVVYNEFKSAIQQNVVVEQLLPIVPDEADEHAISSDVIYEPSEGQVLDAILPLFVKVQLWRILLESFAAEMGARMTAMENATNNAQELIESLTLTYNKARQAAITRELLDIVAGAEGLQ
ncbi:MAG: ATP synthase F1 subunit gamma [bacterium]|nr:ATP synthase F1 subunit gamma [bacterium]